MRRAGPVKLTSVASALSASRSLLLLIVGRRHERWDGGMHLVGVAAHHEGHVVVQALGDGDFGCIGERPGVA
jgi:hypothetical protein